MAKVKGPLMSMEASGTVAGAIVFSSNKGRQYVRQHVIPNNPQSAAQTGVRSSMAGLVALWQANTVSLMSAFATRAKQLNISEFNAFTGFNQKRRAEGHGPANTTAPTNAAPATDISGATATVSEKYVELDWTDSGAADAWANVIYRKLGADPTGMPNEQIALVPAGVEKFVDGPLAAGTWHYIIVAESEHGAEHALGAAVTAVVA